MTEPSTAVLYGAKSSEDRHGSIGTQLEDGRALTVRDGLEVTGEYHDESASAYRGNRGDGLQRALDHAEREGAALIVQHSDRLARGDGDQARHLVELVLWARKAGVTLRSVQDPQTFDGMGLVYAALMGDRNHEDSARKSKSVKDGLARRKGRGAPVGPVPIGYTVEQEAIEGKVITRRVVDPATAPIVELIADVVEAGGTPGDAARQLNALGYTGKRDGAFNARTVRDVLMNSDYGGSGGYPAIIEASRWEAIQDARRRLDPSAVQCRKGGRPPGDESYLLRGIARCLGCGATLYTRPLAAGRMYHCANSRTSTGLCSAPAIPAVLIERHVLNHLHMFIGSVEDWIAERLHERSAEQGQREATVDRERARLADLDRDRERHLAEYRKLVAEGRSVASIALEEVERIDRERAAQERVIEKASAVVGEWTGPPDTDAALDYYSRIVDLVDGRVRAARGARELNQALRQVIAGLWAEVDDQKLVAEFALRAPEPGDGKLNGLTQAMWPDVEGRRVAFPSVVTPTDSELIPASLAPAKPGVSPWSS